MEIMNRIGNALNALYPTIEVYIDDIKQNAMEECFILQFVSKRDVKVAGIKCNKAYTIDIVYIGKEDEEIFKMIDDMERKLYKDIPYMSYEIEIIEKEGHFMIEVMDSNQKAKEPYVSTGFYKILAEEIQTVSKKPCYFYTVDLQSVDFERGFFVIKPTSLETSTISLNHRKEFEQEIKLIYLENSSKHPMKILEEHETFMVLLTKDSILKKQYINLDYNINVEDEEEEKYYAEVACFATNLTIQRRG